MKENFPNQRLLILALVFCTLALSSAYGQYTWSEIQSGSGTVWGSSFTELDYGGYYYGASVYGDLYDPNGNVLDSGGNAGDWSAEVDLEGPASVAGYYEEAGWHWADYLPDGYECDEDDWEYLGDSADWTYVYPPGSGPPQISFISPPSATYGEGGYIEIIGTNFDPEDCACVGWISFGTVESVSATQINIYYSDSEPVNSYSIQMETESGMYSNAATFTIAGDPTPTISSVSPQTWSAGTTVSVSIFGSGFGTSPTLTISCCGIDSFSVAYASDTWISASVKVDPNAPTTTVTLSVTSNGYNGFGFLPQNPGQSNQGNAQAQVQAQCPTPALQVTSNGGQISAGQTVYVTPAPQMPAIAAALVAAPGCVVTGTVIYQLSTTYTGGSSVYPARPISQSASQPFNVPTSFFYGGQATLAWTYNSVVQPSFAFNILGQNPSTATIAASLSGWAVNIGIHESGLQQFASTGLPIKDYAGGYGVMQLTTPAPSEDQKWNWQSNVSAGTAHLVINMVSGLSWMNTQTGQWMTWNSDPANTYVPPIGDYWEGNCCIFSMQSTGTYAYAVAVGLKQYAGAPPPYGNFITWYNTNLPQGTNPFWLISPSNGVAEDIVYQFASCSSLAACQHSGAGHPGDN